MAHAWCMQRWLRSPLHGPQVRSSELANDYHIGRRIGSGGFGAVYRATNNATNEEVAVRATHLLARSLSESMLWAYMGTVPRPIHMLGIPPGHHLSCCRCMPPWFPSPHLDATHP